MSEFDNQRWLPPFKAHLIKQGFKPSTIKRYLSVCQGFLDYLQREGIAVEQVNPPILNVYLQLQVQRYRQRHGHLPRDIRTARHLFDRGITPLLRFVQGRWPPSSQPATRLDRFDLTTTFLAYAKDRLFGHIPDAVQREAELGDRFRAELRAHAEMHSDEAREGDDRE